MKDAEKPAENAYRVERSQIGAGAWKAAERQSSPRFRIAVLAIRRTLAGAPTKAYLGTSSGSR